MNDQQIIDLFWSRSPSAIAETSVRYGHLCRAIAGRILSDPRDAEECENDAYLRLWNSIPPTRPDNLQNYLAKIVRRLALNRLEKNTAEKRAGEQYQLALEELQEVLPAAEDDPTTDLALTQLLNHFLASLPDQPRIIFLRRYWRFQSIKEIAEEMNLGESRVKMSLLRTRNRLKTLLEKEGIR